ncbi:MAG: hypothetical protein KA768_00810 [Desulfobulbus sp.]|uniref:hypothetical protein n=1 Tax=uncultured Desulfobulbus sp. TaxID=239745 RepID=UPI001B4E6D4B|nr:hypothetical protein [uncultured Desulfobulbus sp.]MBP7516354.1 hypothetical protein [Desulfobulbus sp.]
MKTIGKIEKERIYANKGLYSGFCDLRNLFFYFAQFAQAEQGDVGFATIRLILKRNTIFAAACRESGLEKPK